MHTAADRHVRYSCICASMHTIQALNESSALQRFEHANTIKICNGQFLPCTATHV